MTTIDADFYRLPLSAPSPVKVPVDRTALVIVDMQNDFCRLIGSRFIGDVITFAIPRTKDLLKKARAHGMRVIYTQSWHEPDDPRYSDHPRASIGSKGNKANTWGAQIIDELQPTQGEPVIRKGTYDCWFGTEMEQTLKAMSFGTFEPDSAHKNRMRHECKVIITGTATDGCVDRALGGFYFRGYDIIVPVDCVSTRNPLNQHSALYRFENYYFATLTRSELIEFES